jgi:hypothetical protein
MDDIRLGSVLRGCEMAGCSLIVGKVVSPA